MLLPLTPFFALMRRRLMPTPYAMPIRHAAAFAANITLPPVLSAHAQDAICFARYAACAARGAQMLAQARCARSDIEQMIT